MSDADDTPRIDSRLIDSRQRRTLSTERWASASPARTTPDAAPSDPSRSALDERRAFLGLLSPTQTKSFENRLRRMADRQDLHLIKSRRRDRRAADHGKYMLVDASTTDVATGGNWTLDLADVEQILLGTDPAARRLNACGCPKCGTSTYSLSGLVRGGMVDERECPDCGHAFIAYPTLPSNAAEPVANGPTAGDG